MILFTDRFTGDEILSDLYSLKDEGAVYEVDCAMVESPNMGADLSTQEADEDPDCTSVVNNIVAAFRLQQTVFDKKSYLAHLKSYFKAVKASMMEANAPVDEVSNFEQSAQTYVKEKLLPNFRDLEFYTGESMDPDGLVVVQNYREDGVTPYVIVWKAGLTATNI